MRVANSEPAAGQETRSWPPIPPNLIGDVLEQTGDHAEAAEREAFIGQLYAEHGTALKFFVMRLNAGDRQSAEDIVQEAMLRAWRNTDSLRGSDRPIRPWLFTVARRLVIDAKRGRDRAPDEVGYPAATAADRYSERDFEAVHTRDEVTRALRSLTPAQREVVVYTHFLGLPVAEVAERVGLPPGTVKSRSFNALRVLRTRLLAESAKV